MARARRTRTADRRPPKGTRRLRTVALASGVGLALAFAGSAAAVGCGGSDLQLCGQIPDGGCPIGRGGSCDDAACAALYDCVEGAWQPVETCEPAPQGGHGGAGGQPSAGSGGSVAVGGCGAVELDHTGETQGCQPDLQEPDCPVAAAETCAPCLTGCIDFFMCMSVGWVDVAYCAEDGELVLIRP